MTTITETPAAETTAVAEDTEPVAPEAVVAEPVVAEPVVAEPVVAEPVVVAAVVAEPVAGEAVVVEPVVAEPVAASAPDAGLPLVNYDALTLPSLRARLRILSAAQVAELLAYEKSHADRGEIVTMFERRIAKLEAEA